MLQASSPVVASPPLPVFRFHIKHEPDSLDPATSLNTISSYVLNSLYTPLMAYQGGELKPAGAKQCLRVTSTLYRCTLRDDWYWSDNVKVSADQIEAGFAALQAEKSVRLDHFKNIKAVKSKSPHQVDIILKKPDSDFLYKLIDPSLGPRRKDVELKSGLITYGPYSLKEKIPGRSLYLKLNPKFFIQNLNPSDIEVLIVDAEDTALRLFESKKLNFLRQLTTENIALYKDKPEFMQRSLHRIDYIGFGPQLEPYPDLRKRLIYSLKPQYDKFIKIFGALGRPGCFGLEKTIVGKNQCYADQSVKPYTEKEIERLPKLLLYFSMLGGGDISRTMEFFQAGWKKNLNLNVELRQTEQQLLTQLLKDSPPSLFRRGVPLESPTCLAALEVFESGSPDNYIKLKSKELDSIIAKMRSQSASANKSLCERGLKTLLETHRIIPMGSIHFSMLNDHKFTGFSLNELNQLDVSRLSAKAP